MSSLVFVGFHHCWLISLALYVQLFQEVVRFLHSLAVASKDCAMVMCGLRAGDILSKALDKQSSDELTSKLRDLLTTCETYTAVHHKMAACVVAGCMQVHTCPLLCEFRGTL